MYVEGCTVKRDVAASGYSGGGRSAIGAWIVHLNTLNMNNESIKRIH